MRRKGFEHYPGTEVLKKYARLSAKQKLEWLEEINRFLWKALSPEKKRLVEKFRRGEI